MVWAPRLPPDLPPEPILPVAENIGIWAGKESGLKRRALVAAVAVLAGALLVASYAFWRFTGGQSKHPTPVVPNQDWPADAAALAFLDEIPLYRSLTRTHSLRSASVDNRGILHVEIDLRAALEPRLLAMGFPGASELFPAIATGTIAKESVAGKPATVILRESWSFDGPSAALDLFDRSPTGPAATLALTAITGAPASLVSVHMIPARLTDPGLGGSALAPWLDRANFAERLLGRPLRKELSEDLSGVAVFALYEGSEDSLPDAVLAAELRRSDRIAALFDMLLGLGALTERATVVRYRGVATGSYVPKLGGPGIAIAVDGPILLVATSRSRLEAAIDARRANSAFRGELPRAGAPDASWSAVSSSGFVRRGWSRLAPSTDDEKQSPNPLMTASLHPEGASGWRLDGYGPAPAITADPILPFLRSVLGRRQR